MTRVCRYMDCAKLELFGNWGCLCMIHFTPVVPSWLTVQKVGPERKKPTLGEKAPPPPHLKLAGICVGKENAFCFRCVPSANSSHTFHPFSGKDVCKVIKTLDVVSMFVSIFDSMESTFPLAIKFFSYAMCNTTIVSNGSM